MAAARRRDEKMEAMVTYTEDNQKLAHAAKAEIDIANRRRAAHMGSVQAEERMNAMIEQAEYAARNEERVTEQNKRLAAEFERRRTERERKEREIQRICEESEELRDLERALKTAYMNKERAAQHEERVVSARMEREQQQAIEDAMEVDRQAMQAAEREKERARKTVGLEQKVILHKQMEEREGLLREAAVEAARDKELVDEIVAKLEAEDAVKAAIVEKNKNETRAIIKAYEIQRKQEKLDAKAAYEAEEAEIRAHLDAMAKRNEGVAQRRADKEAAQAAAFASIAEEAEKKRLEEEELNRLRDLLWGEELEAKRKAEEDGRIAARASQKAEMAKANKQMLAAKAEKRAVEMAEEQKLIDLMLKKFAEDESNERKVSSATDMPSLLHTLALLWPLSPFTSLSPHTPRARIGGGAARSQSDEVQKRNRGAAAAAPADVREGEGSGARGRVRREGGGGVPQGRSRRGTAAVARGAREASARLLTKGRAAIEGGARARECLEGFLAVVAAETPACRAMRGDKLDSGHVTTGI